MQDSGAKIYEKQNLIMKYTNSYSHWPAVVLAAFGWPQHTSKDPRQAPNWSWLEHLSYSKLATSLIFSLSWLSCKIWKVQNTKKNWFYHIKLSQKSHFVLWISQLPKITQNWFCIQNLCMDLSFQEKKTIKKSDNWLPRY